MAVVETLEVRFQADLSKFSAQLTQLAAQIGGVGMALEAGRGRLFQGGSGLINTVGQALQAGAAAHAS